MLLLTTRRLKQCRNTGEAWQGSGNMPVLFDGQGWVKGEGLECVNGWETCAQGRGREEMGWEERVVGTGTSEDSGLGNCGCI